MSLLVSVFPKVLTPKEVVTWTSKAPCFRTPFGNQRVQEFQTLSKKHYITIILSVPWIWEKLSWKKCRLVRFEILELFVNTLTTDDKYSSRNIQNLTQQLQTTMSQKQKTFYRIFITYVKSRRSSDDFVKKDESSSLSIYEIIDAEKGCSLKRLIDLASEHLLLINVFRSSKNCWNQHRATYYLVFPLIWDK